MRKIIAVLRAFLLTVSLVLFCVSFIGRGIILPAMGEDGAQVSDAVIREEQELARKRVEELSGLYGFDAETAAAAIDEETLRDLNRQASGWWGTLLQTGTADDAISWSTVKVEQALASDPVLNTMEDREQAEYLATVSTDAIRESIVRMVLPMRLPTIRLGLQEIGKRADITNLINFSVDIPWTALALCALLAGLIALLGKQGSGDARQYIGSAMGAAALVLTVLLILYMSIGVLPMIREASAGLTIQYRSVISGAMVRGVLLAAALAAGCILCLAGNRGKKETV